MGLFTDIIKAMLMPSLADGTFRFNWFILPQKRCKHVQLVKNLTDFGLGPRTYEEEGQLELAMDLIGNLE